MDYAGNSNKDKAAAAKPTEPKVIEQIVTGKVVVKKKGPLQKFKTIFFNGDAKTTAGFVAADVILPAMRDLVFAAWQESGRSMLFGQGRGRQQPEMRGNIRYENVTRLRPDAIMVPGQPPRSMQRINRKEANDILISSREEAEKVLEQLIETVDKYNVASLADLHEMLGLPSSHVDHKWGWTRMTQATIRQIREGYLLELPSMEEI